MKTLIIDNFDSFTYNLYQYVAEINGVEPLVIQNNSHTLDEILELSFDNIIISPGPGHPKHCKDFGICAQVIQHCHVPILGICLGHQGIVQAFGGEIIHAPKPMHGQLSTITHQGDEIFLNIPHEFQVVRYHSLIAHHPLPTCLKSIASTENGLVMAVKHKSRPIWGIQYHPESISTEYGKQLLNNFKNLTPLKFPHTSQKSHVAPEKEYDYALHVEHLIQPNGLIQNLISQLQNEKHWIWLDSSRVMPNSSRFSIFGSLNGPLSYHLQYDMKNQYISRSNGPDLNMSIFEYLKEELKKYAHSSLNLPFDFQCGFVGYFGYELYQETLNIPAKHCSVHPDAQFLFLDRAIVIDHTNHNYYLLALTPKDQTHEATLWFQETQKTIFSTKNNFKAPSFYYDFPHLSQSKSEYIKKIKDCFEHIREGESYEICLTNRLKYHVAIPGLDFYLKLREKSPAPYAAFLRFNDLDIACSSMERFLKLDTQGYIETKPIKGTLPRGKTPEADALLKHQLKHNIKFQSENLMIVDLLRNDLGKICEIGSIKVPKLMQVESYATVHQLVSTIQGQLKKPYDAIDCIKAAFPGGSMTGAPKIRTVEIIASLEKDARGIYSGNIGYLSLNGAMDFNIVIRTAMITPLETTIGVGGAVIALSTPEEEFDEIILKAKALDDALREIAESEQSLINSLF